jgi:uncharacterized protein
VETEAEVWIQTSAGPARVAIEVPAGQPKFLLVLTHGSGGTADTADVLAVRDAGLALGAVTALVNQPYVVRGAKAPGSAARQDAAWAEIAAALRTRQPGLPLIQGGRSNGARVACRTARAAGARAVLALAFPLHPPGRPDRSRAAELLEAGTDVLVINGDRDPFGVPADADGIRVVMLAGASHSLARQGREIRPAVQAWLAGLLVPEGR